MLCSSLIEGNCYFLKVLFSRAYYILLNNIGFIGLKSNFEMVYLYIPELS